VTAFAITDMILVPILIRYGFRYLGRSPVSHRSDMGPGSGLEEKTRALQAHAGRTVITETALRPAGKVRFDGEIFEAETAGEFVEKGAEVRLTAARGSGFLVEKIGGSGGEEKEKQSIEKPAVEA
jgi:membrane protein implicated in regulation of membrane protease activity